MSKGVIRACVQSFECSTNKSIAVYCETIHFIPFSECTCMSIVQSYQGFHNESKFLVIHAVLQRLNLLLHGICIVAPSASYAERLNVKRPLLRDVL